MIDQETCKDQTCVALKALEACAFKFFLTGSRYFGTASQTADYDFIAPAKEDVEEYLVSQGFTSIVWGGYELADNHDVQAIYRLGKVDVQLVADPAKKLKTQKKLAKTQAFMEASKRRRSEMWSLALSLLDD